MSTERNDFGTSFIIFAGSTKTFTLTIKDPDTGLVFNLSNTTDFDTGEVKIIKPDGTIITTVAIVYSNRTDGEVQFEILAADATNANAGNWKGELELSNDSAVVIEQQAFNFNIIESQ